MTSISQISARRSLVSWIKFQILVGPRPCVGPLSGGEGKKCQPIDRMRHISFIRQLCAPPYNKKRFSYLYTKLFQLSISPICYLHCVLEHCTFVIYACTFPEAPISRFSVILKYFISPLCGTYCYEIQRDTAIKTRHRCIASLRKERVSNTRWLLHTTLSQMERFVQTFK